MVGAAVNGTRSSGFTLLEVVIALGLMSGALVALAHVILQAGQASATARRTALASVLALEKLEQLRGLAWGYDEEGGHVQDSRSDASGALVSESGGIGVSVSPRDSLAEDVPGFVDYHEASGRWIGHGGAPPANAAFTRRWSVTPLEDAPGDTLVLQVTVLALANAAAGGGPGSELAHVATLKTRRPR
jgi:hypothetical protein